VSFLGIGLAPHALVIAFVAGATLLTLPRFLLGDAERTASTSEKPMTLGERLGVWREPRTVAIGLIALGMAFAEGSANDWLALAIVDGRDASNAIGALWFGFFTAGMMAGRIGGVWVLDRFGRVPVLQASAGLAILGLALVIMVAQPVVSGVGALLWGIGSSLGFPVAMSAAADDVRGSAARVSAVATLAYGAFLIGPPLIGGVGEAIGLLAALWAVVLLILVAFFASPAASPTKTASP
jgi:fucose permease